ncbi:MAG: SIMPL domain-containing protein [Betaproteobacteria bacterium]
MSAHCALVFALAVAALTGPVRAADTPSPIMPLVSLNAAATASVPNDRVYAWLRAEVDNADPARAAAEVNTRIARALARAKAVTGVEAATSGYSSYQFTEKNQPTRWRVVQTLTLEASDFTAMAALVTKLQADDALVLSGMNFAVSPEARRRAEDNLTQQAIKAWQLRAQNAANGFGFQSWRMGKVAIQTGDFARPTPMYRQSMNAMAASAPPVTIEAGNTDITVTVSGDAVLEGARPAAR